MFVALAAVAALGGADEGSGADAFWRPEASAARVEAQGDLRVRPGTHRRLRLDRDVMGRALAGAPLAAPETSVDDMETPIISLPMPDGSLVRFRVVEDPILDVATAAANPDLKTYAVASTTLPTLSGRLTWTPTGLHAVLLTPTGAVHVDPLYVGDAAVHAVYPRTDAGAEAEPFVCHTRSDRGPARALRLPGGGAAVTIGGTLHTYRECITTTPAYTAWAVANAGSVTAAVTTVVNAVNVFLQRDLAIRLNLVVDTDLFYDGTPAPPYTVDFTSNATVNAMLAGIHGAIVGEVGVGGFDVGHCFDLAGNGGVASLGVVCDDANKGRGYTSTGDPGSAIFRTRFAHESGHQFNADHTWSSDSFDAGQFSAAAGWEVGNGTTMMSYGHIADANSVPGAVREDYYHGGTIEQIRAFVGGHACDGEVATGNTPPSVDAGPDRDIPALTPFVLTGSGADVDDPAGNLTFTWEQMDPAAVQIPFTTADDGVIPLFRSFFPTAGGATRTVPRLSDLVAGTTFPAIAEQLPSTARTIGFRLTVRDNRPGSGTVTGGVNQDDVTLVVNAAAGPFAVTSPNGGESWPQGTAQTVTWDVAGTTAAPIGTANVRILLSTDGGFTYPTVLLASTANDGSESVTLPACENATTCRVRVEAVGNIFFDISDGDFSITDVTPPTVTANVGRAVLWPATRGLLDVSLSHSAVDSCPGAVSLQDVLVHSDEGNGAAPYAPDATLVGAVLRLRSERAVPGDGRVYLVVPRYGDSSGNVGAGCASVVVPGNLTVAHMTALLLDASLKRAACLAANGAAPAGTSQILP